MCSSLAMASCSGTGRQEAGSNRTGCTQCPPHRGTIITGSPGIAAAPEGAGNLNKVEEALREGLVTVTNLLYFLSLGS